MTSLPDLPDACLARAPGQEDIPALARLLAAHRAAHRADADRDGREDGRGGGQQDAVAALVTGTGSWTRQQLIVIGPEGAPLAWVAVHDRAAGRSVVDLTVAPDLEPRIADPVAGSLLAWAQERAQAAASARGLTATRLDASAYDGDERQRAWLRGAGYTYARTWLHLSRPVVTDELLPEPRPGVRVRRVATHGNGLPVADDLQTVHRMLEESFADHFNSYRESFPEFVTRLREDPGHRWDHWWLAEAPLGQPVSGQARPAQGLRPAGALVASLIPAEAGRAAGTYIDYIGVHRDARGLGVAKALLHAVLTDARDRGHDRVDLEVDGDSPTSADGLYLSMGWEHRYRTETWHRDVTVPD